MLTTTKTMMMRKVVMEEDDDGLGDTDSDHYGDGDDVMMLIG